MESLCKKDMLLPTITKSHTCMVPVLDICQVMQYNMNLTPVTSDSTITSDPAYQLANFVYKNIKHYIYLWLLNKPIYFLVFILRPSVK